MKKGILSTVTALMGIATGSVGSFYLTNKKVLEYKEKFDKFKAYYNMLNQWMILKESGKSLEQYFIDKGYKTIAVYGMGEMGNRLIEELQKSSIEIKYGIDKDGGFTDSNIDIKFLEDDLDEADVIVVTPIFAYEDIEKELKNVLDYPIESLEEVVFGID